MALQNEQLSSQLEENRRTHAQAMKALELKNSNEEQSNEAHQASI
jgi:hypothetical protein